MRTTRLLGAAAAAALLAGAAQAQAPAKPAAQPVPAAPPAVQPTTPAPAAETTPPTPSAAPAPTPAPAAPAATAVAPAPATASVGLAAQGDIVDTLKANGQFKTLVKALDATNMTSVLKTNRNLTIFAPTDAAFAALPPGELDRLMKDPAALQKLLTYHVINATVDSTKIKGAKGGVKTVAGSELVVDGSGATLLANNASIVQADVKPTNGTIHVVDKVLKPENAPSVAAAATTGATSDAAATTPAQPATPAQPQPATPPTATQPGEPAAQPGSEPADPDTPVEPSVPPKI